MIDELVKATASGAGFAGLLLLYHLFVTHKEVQGLQAGQRRIEEAIDRSTHSDMLRLIASPHVATELKDAATEVLRQTEAAQKRMDLERAKEKA